MIYSRLLSQKEIRICEYWAGWLPSLCFLYFNCRMWCCCCYYCYYHYDNVLSWWLLKVAMIHTGTMYQYYFFHRDAGRHFFKILNAAIPTGSTDSRTMLHVNVNSIKNVTKKTGMGEVDFSLSKYYIKDWQECLLLLTCKKSTAYQCNIYPSHRQRNGPNNLSMTFQSFIQYFFEKYAYGTSLRAPFHANIVLCNQTDPFISRSFISQDNGTLAPPGHVQVHI